VLIVEDDAGVREAMKRGLMRSFEFTAVASAGEALRVDDHDIALIDLGLPDRDGVELCRELRARHPERPIVVVTGRSDELDVVDALEAGADDYVTKPFSLAVLTARMRRHLDRSATVTVIGGLRIEHRARRAVVDDDELDLTAREFDLLAALAACTGRTIGKDELIASVWDPYWSRSTHTLAVHISALRAKLPNRPDSPTITSVPGIGYRLDATPSNR
jgi:DNA-binding response OmpR family regulator